MGNPLISVIVPVYNTERYLQKCIESICKQSFDNIELICVNDGSQDKSADILKHLSAQDSRMKVIHLKQSSGSAAAPRNIGLKHANGKYIIFLDSDDYFDLNMLEKMYLHAEKYTADLVMCDNYTVDSETGIISDRDTELHKKYLPDKDVFSYRDIPNTIFQISNAAVWHKLILKKLIDDNNLEFQLNVPILDDIYFVNLLLVFARRISILEDRLIYYRRSRVGAQTTAIAKHKESVFKAFLALNCRLKAEGIYDAVDFSLKNWTIVTMAWWLNSICEYDAYAMLYNEYKTKYFEQLGLLGIDPDTLYDELNLFYRSVTEGSFKPSLMVILESLLMPNSAIAIYGAGVYGKKVYGIVQSYGKHRISLWCDRNASKMNNPLISLPEKLAEVKVDAILIAIVNSDIVREVKTFLLNMGIEEGKIHVL